MEKCAECPSGSVLALVMRISQLAGIAPIRFSSGGLRFSRSLALYGHILVTAINLIVLTGFVLDMLDECEESLRVRTSTSQVIWIANLTIIMLISCVGVYMAPKRIAGMIICLKKIYKIKECINADKKLFSDEKLKKCIVIVTCIGLCILICFDLHGYFVETVTHEREVLPQLMYSFRYYEYILVLLAELQFVFIAFNILTALELVNWELQNLTSIADESNPCSSQDFNIKQNNLALDSRIYIPSKDISVTIDSLAKIRKYAMLLWLLIILDNSKQQCKQNGKKVRDLASAYGEICDVVRQINDSHGLLLMLIMTSFFLQLIITPYNLIGSLPFVRSSTCLVLEGFFLQCTGFFTDSSKGRILQLVLQICWCIFHLTCMFLVVEPCYRVQIEMDKTQLLVCRQLYQLTTLNPLVMDLKQFSKQLILNRPTFSPLGLLILSRPVIMTIIGTVTTYLVIIFQFRALESNSNLEQF